MRFELTTSTLARLRSTPELHPLDARKRYNNDFFIFGNIIFKKILGIILYYLYMIPILLFVGPTNVGELN